jgi:hypothetical protein
MNVNPNNLACSSVGWWWIWIPKSVGRASVWWTGIPTSHHSSRSITHRESRSRSFKPSAVTLIREERKLLRAFEAFNLKREGYWGCTNCSAHNLNTFAYCQVCGSLAWKNMPTELLSPGRPISILQNIAYALPVSRCVIYCDTAAATLFQSNTVDFTLSNAITLDTNKQAEVAGGFIRVTSAGPVIIELKKA